MAEPKKDDLEKDAKQRKSDVREFKEFKINGMAVRGDVDAPSDAEFEWMPNDD